MCSSMTNFRLICILSLLQMACIVKNDQKNLNCNQILNFDVFYNHPIYQSGPYLAHENIPWFNLAIYIFLIKFSILGGEIFFLQLGCMLFVDDFGVCLERDRDRES